MPPTHYCINQACGWTGDTPTTPHPDGDYGHGCPECYANALPVGAMNPCEEVRRIVFGAGQAAESEGRR